MAEKPADSAVAYAMKQMENDIRELTHMSEIAAEYYDTLHSPPNRIKSNDHNSATYRMTVHEDDQLAFLVNNVASRCSLLKKRFDAAYEGVSPDE